MRIDGLQKGDLVDNKIVIRHEVIMLNRPEGAIYRYVLQDLNLNNEFKVGYGHEQINATVVQGSFA